MANENKKNTKVETSEEVDEEGMVVIDLDSLKEEDKGANTEEIFNSAKKKPEPVEVEITDDNEEGEEEQAEEESDDNEEEEEAPVEKEEKKLSPSQKRIVELNQKKKLAEEEAKKERIARIRLEEQLRTSNFEGAKRNHESLKQALESQMKLAKSEFIRASNDGDTEKAFEAQSLVSKAQTQLLAIDAALENMKTEQPRQEQQNKQAQNEDNSSFDEGVARKLAAKWLKGHSKVYADQNYANLVKQLSNQISAEGELTQDSEEYWEELDTLLQDVEQQKGSAKKTSGNSGGKQIVASNGTAKASQNMKQSQVNNNKNKIKLTPNEVRLAKKWNISLLDFAKQKASESDLVFID